MSTSENNKRMIFSERYGYVKPSDALILECIPKELENGLCNAFAMLRDALPVNTYGFRNTYEQLQEYLWVFFLKRLSDDFQRGYDVISSYLQSEDNPWYKKFDLIESAIYFLTNQCERGNIYEKHIRDLKKVLNLFLEQNHSGYRVVGDLVTPITSPEEITEIERAMTSNGDAVSTHISEAIKSYSKRPDADYRNSIKESISAVEAIFKNLTNKKTLGDALNEIKNKHKDTINVMLIEALNKFYAFTNSKETGIRHSTTDDSKNLPGEPEAHMMLVICSAYVNFIRQKFNVMEDRTKE